MATKKTDQPDITDDDAVVAWLTDEDATIAERERRGTLIEGEYTRKPDASRAVLNALASVKQGPPSANQ